MSAEQSREWSGASKLLHWLLFAFVIAAFVAVNIAETYERGDPEKLWWMRTHLSVGISAMLVMIAWLIVLAKQGRPLRSGAPWQIMLARVTHWGMAILVIAMPIAGVSATLLSGYDVVLYGFITIPPFIAENEELAKQVLEVHKHVAAPAFATLILLHIAGTLWHASIDKDDTLKRILP